MSLKNLIKKSEYIIVKVNKYTTTAILLALAAALQSTRRHSRRIPHAVEIASSAATTAAPARRSSHLRDSNQGLLLNAHDEVTEAVVNERVGQPPAPLRRRRLSVVQVPRPARKGAVKVHGVVEGDGLRELVSVACLRQTKFPFNYFSTLLL